MMQNLFIFIPIVLLTATSYAQVILDLEIDHIRNSEGVIRLAVYTKDCEFPENPAFTHIIKKDSLRDHKIKTKIYSLHPGIYAFSLLDDENNNDAMDYNALRIPVEGFGFSSSSTPFLRAPPYKKCTVELKPGENKLYMKIRYKL